MLRLLLFLASALFVDAATAQRCEAQDLRKFSSKVLISCFTSLKPCFADQWMIADELARRGSTDSIFALYWKTKDEALRAGIEKIAYRRSDEAALAFMRKVLQTGLDDGQELYVPLNYLAKSCLDIGLKALATGKFRNQGSLQYATSIELLGTCHYRASIPYLVDEALWDASLNIVAAAQNSLIKLFPDAPSDFSDLGSMQRYYCHRASSAGYNVQCAARIER